MIRTLALICLAACSQSQASKLDDKPAPTQPPRNFVCERLAIADKEAKCDPEWTHENIHTARVTQKGGTFSCGLAVGALSVVCDPLFAKVQEPVPEQGEAKLSPTAKPAPAKGAKK